MDGEQSVLWPPNRQGLCNNEILIFTYFGMMWVFSGPIFGVKETIVISAEHRYVVA